MASRQLAEVLLCFIVSGVTVPVVFWIFQEFFTDESDDDSDSEDF